MSVKNHNVALPMWTLISFFLLVAALSAQSQPDGPRSSQWRIAGQNLNNTWSQPAEHSISPTNVQNLKPKWIFTTGGDVSATPTVDGDAVYFPIGAAISSPSRRIAANSSGLARSPTMMALPELSLVSVPRWLATRYLLETF